MSAILENGDYVLGERGLLLEAKGSRELVEQALIRLKSRKGGFALDPEIGSTLHQIPLAEADSSLIEAVFCEALAPIPEVQVASVTKTTETDGVHIQAKLQVRETVSQIQIREEEPGLFSISQKEDQT